jgi:GNAT superfamily N-acetyltransferase
MIRAARPEDMDEITFVRTSVLENHLSLEGMATLGITPAGVAENLRSGDLGGWVAKEEGRIVAFSMADRRDGQIFALFTLPGHEGRGHGTALLQAAVDWLRGHGCDEAWLSTDPGTKADRFYARRGWSRGGLKANGEVYYRLRL